MSASPPEAFLFLYGADAVGKSTVGWEIYERLVGRGVAVGYVDLDYLGFCTPTLGDGPERLAALNLAAVWENFRLAGARCLVVAGVIPSREAAELYRAAVPGPVLCRLTASPAELAARILRRGRIEGADTDGAVSTLTLDGLRAYGERAARFAAHLAADDVSDLVVDTDGRSVPEVADEVLARTRLGTPPLA